MERSDEEALMDAIRNDPNDDTVRLAYADWLDENAACNACFGTTLAGWGAWDKNHGPCAECRGTGTNGNAARAEFVRVQVAIAGEPTGNFYSLNRKRERELLTPPTNHDSWCAPIPRIGGVGITFRRGFVDEVRLTLAQFVGGPCGHSGDEHRRDRQRGEPYPCASTDRTPGLAAAIGAHPVRRVGLTDRSSQEYYYDSLLTVYGWRSTPEGRPYDIPPDLLNIMRRMFPKNAKGKVNWVDFDTEQAARDALSEACVEYARTEFQKSRSKLCG